MYNPGRRVRRGRLNRRASPVSIFGMKKLVIFCLVITMVQCFYSYGLPSRRELSNLMRNVDDVAKEMNAINNNYQVLQNKLSAYSKELPKLEEQVMALEALAQTIQGSRTTPCLKQASLPYVVVSSMNSFNKTMQKIPVQNRMLKNYVLAQ